MAKIRQSFRRKKKKGKEDTAKEESCPVPETAEQLDIEPFDKRSKFRRSLSFRKKKVKLKLKKNMLYILFKRDISKHRSQKFRDFSKGLLRFD